jgi:transcriptional regulator with XRE-family HTH domain
MSQLTLATAARVTPRHVSFVESGRSQPSREMVLTLAGTLDVPLRERNQMLLAAGFAPMFRDTDPDDALMAPVWAAVDRMLVHHQPYPAVVLDRYWNVTRTNAAADALFSFLLDGAVPDPSNVVRLMFDPAALRPSVSNWEEVATALLQRVHREAVGGVPDEQTRALIDEVLAYPGVPSRWRRPAFDRPLVPVVPVRFDHNGVRLHYFSMVTTVGTPQDISAQEIRVESFFPVDSATSAHRFVHYGQTDDEPRRDA